MRNTKDKLIFEYVKSGGYKQLEQNYIEQETQQTDNWMISSVKRLRSFMYQIIAQIQTMCGEERKQNMAIHKESFLKIDLENVEFIDFIVACQQSDYSKSDDGAPYTTK